MARDRSFRGKEPCSFWPTVVCSGLIPKRVGYWRQSLPTSVFGFALPKMNVGTPFDRVSPDGWAHERPEYLAVEPQGANIWCYHKGTLEKLDLER
jgi:hypothetical protein